MPWDGASHPSRVRGLKPPRAARQIQGQRVAPLAGAWIETPLSYALYIGGWRVAPLAGAWIETQLMKKPGYRRERRRTPRGCVD